jgi:tRNA (mo5U34)-methyltransferase
VRFGDREINLVARRTHPDPVGELTDGPIRRPRTYERSVDRAIAYLKPTGEAEAAEAPRYHTVEMPDGTVLQGAWDHRELAKDYGFPEDMTGMRALDVAAFDGFWSFEMERRGATVTALDLPRHNDSDLPPPAKEELTRRYGEVLTAPTFERTREMLGSKVERVQTSIYDADPATLGTFDFVHIADVLLHLERPWQALRKVRELTTKQALIVDAYEPDLEWGPRGPTMQYLGGWFDVVWWVPSLDALAQMVIDAGFRTVRVHRTYSLRAVGDPEPGLWRAAMIAEV